MRPGSTRDCPGNDGASHGATTSRNLHWIARSAALHGSAAPPPSLSSFSLRVSASPRAANAASSPSRRLPHANARLPGSLGNSPQPAGAISQTRFSNLRSPRAKPVPPLYNFPDFRQVRRFRTQVGKPAADRKVLPGPGRVHRRGCLSQNASFSGHFDSVHSNGTFRCAGFPDLAKRLLYSRV